MATRWPSGCAAFPTPEGEDGGFLAEVSLRGGRVRSLRADGRTAGSVTLEPPLLAFFYGPDFAERRPVTLDEMPEYVSQAVLAAEDHAFFTHAARFSNRYRARPLGEPPRGELQQGGSRSPSSS